MSDPDTQRPELPDPQRDRHVAFSDDGPVGGGRPAPKGAFTPSLPPEAWAPRPAENTSSAAAPTLSTRQPAVQPGSILTTPPHRPYPSASRGGNVPLGAKVLAGLVLVPLMIGLLSSGSSDPYAYNGDSGIGVETPVGGDMPMGGDVAPGVDPMSVDPVTVELEADTADVLPALPGKPKTVAVPNGATSLRVEVVSLDGSDDAPAADVVLQTFANDFATDTSSMSLPFAATVNLNERPARLHMSASVLAGTGRLQCRVYAGDRLVAISNGGTTVTCSPEM